MRDLTRQGKKNPVVRDTAASIVQTCPPKNWRCEIECLWRWTLDNIRYTMDINNCETLSDAPGTLERGWGDCDDKAVLLASMLESIGHPTRFVAMGPSLGNYTHVIVETRMGTGWKALDATEDRPFGWRPPDLPYEMMVHN